MNNFYINNSKIQYRIPENYKNRNKVIKQNVSFGKDSFNGKTHKNKKKAIRNFSLLIASLLSLTSCAKSNSPNVYENIGSSQTNLSSFSESYFEEYNKSNIVNKDVQEAIEEADSYTKVPFIGEFLYSNLGIEGIEYAVADEGNVINGYIDEDIVQGIVSDCWLITAIENLSYTKKGAELIHNAITQDKNGNINVYLKGPNLSYTVTKEEIEKANKEHSIYSRGDDDMLVIELAVEKFREDLKDNKIEIDNTLPDYLYYTNTDGYNALRLGETRQAYWLMTGITDSTTASTKEEIDEVLERYRNNKENALLDVELNKNAKVKDINGQTTYIYAAHGYGVKDISDDTITLICASYNNKEIILPLDTLYNLPIDMLVYAEI